MVNVLSFILCQEKGYVKQEKDKGMLPVYSLFKGGGKIMFSLIVCIFRTHCQSGKKILSVVQFKTEHKADGRKSYLWKHKLHADK